MSVWRSDLAWSSVLALVVLGPLLAGSGYWLYGDMVFVPEQPWKAAWLGLDGALPRAVPMDALVSLVTHVVPGSLLQRALLVGGFLAGGLGVGRLLRAHAWYARAAAITLLCWNPWVYERLLIGQWAILLGYLLLPWVALAALRLRREARDWGPAALAVVASAVCSPSSGLMSLGVLAVLGLTRDQGAWWRLVLVGALGNLTWAVPALTAESTRVATDGVFSAFAARGESAAGVFPSLLSLGGIWKTSILPNERTDVVLVLLSCLLTGAAVAGLCSGRVPGGHRRWLVLGVSALVVAAVPALAMGAELLEAMAEPVPGLALLRDSHRYLAPLGLVLAVGAAAAVTWLRERIGPGTGALWSAVVLVVVAPVLLLPSLAWGAAGELERSSYPQAWEDVAGLVGADEDSATVVLPWAGSYRGYPWNHRRAVLDPAPRYLPGTVLVDDSVRLEDRIVPAEDPRVDAVRVALAEADPARGLRALGVRWVLIEQQTDDPITPPAGEVVHDAGGLTLVDLATGGAIASSPAAVQPDVPVWRQIAVGTGHAAAILLVCFAFARIRRHTPVRE